LIRCFNGSGGLFIMENKGKLTVEQLSILKDINNPNITKIIELSKDLDVAPILLVEYFILQEENKK